LISAASYDIHHIVLFIEYISPYCRPTRNKNGKISKKKALYATFDFKHLKYDVTVWNYYSLTKKHIDMNAKNQCLPQTFKHCNSKKNLIFKDFRIVYSIVLLCNFQLGFISCGLGKYYTISNGIWLNIGYKISEKIPFINIYTKKNCVTSPPRNCFWYLLLFSV
jgi:hypothetical protein